MEGKYSIIIGIITLAIVGVTGRPTVKNSGTITNREVLVGSNYGTLSCPKGQFNCSKDPNSCCKFVS
ncbi:MAG TPA: hypothetical protein VN026_13590 [Bacteroidia bacterium]|jgi:hypothetical protein|nr:hypothetical protein [Bacteroidia bacterium]